MNSTNTKTCVITGFASGMGRLTAIAAVQAGMHVIGVDFDRAASAAVVAEITAQNLPGRIEYIYCDISSFAEVRALAAQLNTSYPRIDILVNNAGLTESVRRESSDGFEMTMATNFLGPFLLTHLLLDKLRASTPARVINIASDAHKMAKGLDWDDINNRKKWDGVNHGCGFQAYARSKLCLVAFSYDLAEQLANSGVTVYAVSPGYFIKTNIIRHMSGIWRLGVKLAWPFMQSVESGAKTHIFLTTNPDVDGETGKYWEHCQLKESSEFTHDIELRRKIEAWAAQATQIGKA